MVLASRVLFVPVILGLIVLGVAMTAPEEADAASPRITMVDNDAPLPTQAMDARTGQWGFAPAHMVVLKGEVVTFTNPTGNFRPHNVYSLTNTSSFAAEPVFQAGGKFNSGFTVASLVSVGKTWDLDTSTLDPGHYPYVCSLHPWMVGSLSVVAP